HRRERVQDGLTLGDTLTAVSPLLNADQSQRVGTAYAEGVVAGEEIGRASCRERGGAAVGGGRGRKRTDERRGARATKRRTERGQLSCARECFGDVFFFSSRRRHTSLVGVWSAHVCSPDPHRRERVQDGLTLGDTLTAVSPLLNADQSQRVGTAYAECVVAGE